ncbi:hypothetical protein ACFWPQ_21485, partial [Streptomyces sp. NPDC058464]|uniref:hypothetical protein n=1 Tax=Streptomyces sp. NPDC058464 TaxID=3346511 RepID=UPI0036574CD5
MTFVIAQRNSLLSGLRDLYEKDQDRLLFTFVDDHGEFRDPPGHRTTPSQAIIKKKQPTTHPKNKLYHKRIKK